MHALQCEQFLENQFLCFGFHLILLLLQNECNLNSDTKAMIWSNEKGPCLNKGFIKGPFA